MDDDATFDKYANRIRFMLRTEEVQFFDYYIRSFWRKKREMTEKARELLWNGNFEEIYDVIVDKYNELIALDKEKIETRIRFNDPFFHGSSLIMTRVNLKNLFNFMNSKVPDKRNLLLKEVVFDWIEDLICDTENLTSKYLLNDKLNKFKAAYTILEIEQFISNDDHFPIDQCFGKDIALVWGDAVATLNCYLSFDLERNINAYYRIGQGFIQRERAHEYQFMEDYKKALREALIKWKKGDDCDLHEMVIFLKNRSEFSHLESRIILKIIKPYAKRRNRVKGVKGYKKIKDE